MKKKITNKRIIANWESHCLKGIDTYKEAVEHDSYNQGLVVAKVLSWVMFSVFLDCDEYEYVSNKQEEFMDILK